jgi:hypothetical protein
MTQELILKMEISDSCVCAQHLVGGGDVRISLIDWGHAEVSWLQEFSTMVSVATGEWLRQSATWLVLPILYLMLRWNCCKYVDQF